MTDTNPAKQAVETLAYDRSELMPTEIQVTTWKAL